MMKQQSRLLVVIIYGLLISSVYGKETNNDGGFWSYVPDSCTWTSVAAGVGLGVGAVAAAPLVLGAAGFTSVGIAAGSFAAGIQGSSVAAGSAFALLQSAGAGGLALGTKVVVGSTVGAAGYKAYKVATGCKEPSCEENSDGK